MDANGEEEGRAAAVRWGGGEFLERGDGGGGDLGIGVGVVGGVDEFHSGGLLTRDGSAVLGEAVVVAFRHGVELFGHAPRWRVVHVRRAVVDLAKGLGEIAVELKMLGERDDVGRGLAEVLVEVPDADRVGAAAAEKGLARRIADGLLTIGARERRAAGGEPVEVRRDRRRITIAAEVHAEVVDGDKENVGARRG